ncbi:hypothetical protein Dda_2102 [Drechslerella dactyloides]|uniref:Uncharacterized protein n=1 Tax=Drechslerella dactyloides TaxID=74499 RepID=A0AAD6J329_DREDA|nr:hypothetical protein Dda_2102 [Drechslerella dactyloides]
MRASGLHVTTRGDLEGSDLGTGSSSSISSQQTLPSVSDSSITAPDDAFDPRADLGSYSRGFEDERQPYPKYRNVPKFEDKSDLSKYHPIYRSHKYIKSQLPGPHPGINLHDPAAPANMEYDVYGPGSALPTPPPAPTGGPYNHPAENQPPSQQQQQQPIAPEYGYNQIYGYFGPGDLTNIKERNFPPPGMKLPKLTSRAKQPERRVRFKLEPVEEDALDAPIPCDPINCPEARLALENARLPHALISEPSSSTGTSTSHGAVYRRYHKAESTSTAVPGLEGAYYPTSYLDREYGQSSGKTLNFSNPSSTRNSGTPCSGSSSAEASVVRNQRRAGTAANRSRYYPPRPAAHIAEVEGDNEFPAPSDPRHLSRSLAGLDISLSTTSPGSHLSPHQNFSNSDPSWSGHDRLGRNEGVAHASDLTPDSATKKSKDIFKKLLGGRSSRPLDTNVYPLIPKSEYNQPVRYANFESRKEWAFVAISPDARTIVGVCDRDCFTTYSMELAGESAGIKMTVCGEFVAGLCGYVTLWYVDVANLDATYIITLEQLQVFDHHNGRKVYEWSSDKSVAAENFTSIVFANSGLELCAGLTNGTIQFHFIPADNQDYDPDDITFHRGDPRMDIALSSGDYAFTMAFSDDDMQFVCGTQKRMLLVYEFRGATGWELRNKFKFNDWPLIRGRNIPQEPGTHRRISSAIFCPDRRFLFATTTSGRSSAYMRCIDGNKQANCNQSVSHSLPITKKGVCRSAMSPNGKTVALIDGDGTVYRCEFGAGSVLSDKQEFAKLPGTLIPARACWVSWTQRGELLLLDKKGHIRIYDNAAPVIGRSPR